MEQVGQEIGGKRVDRCSENDGEGDVAGGTGEQERGEAGAQECSEEVWSAWDPGQAGASEQSCGEGGADAGEAIAEAIAGDGEREHGGEGNGGGAQVHGGEDPWIKGEGWAAVPADSEAFGDEDGEREEGNEQEAEQPSPGQAEGDAGEGEPEVERGEALFEKVADDLGGARWAGEAV